jgi:hypothetical protein
LAIRAIFGDVCEREWMCSQICPNFEGTKNAFVTKKAKKVTKVILPFIRVIRVIRGLISCVSHNLIVPLAAPKVLRHGCAGKNASTFSCVSHNLIVPLSQFYGNA